MTDDGTVDTAQTPAPAAAGVPAPEPATPAADSDSTATVVEMAVYGRSVRVEAREPLTDVTAAAVALWQHLGEHTDRAPVGTAGFLTGEPFTARPREMTPRTIEPWDGGTRAA